MQEEGTEPIQLLQDQTGEYSPKSYAVLQCDLTVKRNY